MSKPPSSKSIRLSFALMAMIVAISFGLKETGARSVQQDLPEGKGVEIARDKCVSCHEADLIVSQRLSRQGWVREVEKMVRWGAPVTEAEKETLVDYLAVNFGPKTGVLKNSPATTNDGGKEIFENKCLLCHKADLTEQQRLSRQGWLREVDKMIRWGALVTDAEKEILIDYLAKNFGQRPLKTAN